MDIGANPSAEEADEGVESTSRKVVDIIDGFRLVVRCKHICLMQSCVSLLAYVDCVIGLQEQAGYDKKLFMGYIKVCIGDPCTRELQQSTLQQC